MLYRTRKCEQRINDPIIALYSEEVEWLFGIDKAILEKWINAGLLSPAVTSEGVIQFWRKDVANLLAAIGA